jgi:hypothetical protein
MFQSLTFYVVKTSILKNSQKLILHMSNCLLIPPYALNSWLHVHKLKKNNNALIILQCCVISIRWNEIACAITQCVAILKLKPPISCAYTHPLCFCSKKQKKNREKARNKQKNMKKMKRKKKRTKDNQIFSHVKLHFY